MNAIEIRNLSKSFRTMYAVDHLNMTVPQGAIYGFIGENGSGKSTTMKLICGHLVPDEGEIRLFEKEYTNAGVRARVGALIENAGCFPGSSVYQNLMMQCINLGLENADEEIRRVLEIVRMEDNASLKFKSCSLGMKQRIGIAMALLGSPALLILDEPINGLDTDGMRIMQEILVDITQKYGCTVLISSQYVLTKILVGALCGALMLMAYLIGSMLGGAISGLSFDLKGLRAGSVVMCMLAKAFLMPVFVSIFTLISIAAKHKAWLAICGSLGGGMLLFMMVSMITPLASTFVNVVLCAAGGAIFAFGLGEISKVILKKTSLV